MEALNKLVTKIQRTLDVAFEECCLPVTNVWYGAVPGHFVVHYLCQFINKKGQPSSIDVEARIKDNVRRWNKKIEIWSTEHNGIMKLRNCRLPDVIDHLTEAKKALS